MGAGYSQQLFPCFNPAVNRDDDDGEPADVGFTASESLDETLGHSFCYVRSSARFVSPTHSDRFLSPSQSQRFDPVDPVQKEAGFRAISGASVSANTSTPRTVLQIDNINDNATDNSTCCTSSNIQYASGFSTGVKGSIVNGFEGTSSFSALPLQPVPRGGAGAGGCSRQGSGQFEGALFMSGPIQRGALSGPLDSTLGLDGSHNVPFSAPLGGMYVKKRRRKGISAIRKAFSGKFKETKRPWVVPERNFVAGRNDASGGAAASELDMSCESNAQWALGKAGEDRVHVVVSEEHGWLFVGIYDGFNGPDAPEFLMSNLYRTMYKELEGLFWDNSEDSSTSNVATEVRNSGPSSSNPLVEESSKGSVKKVTFQSGEIEVRRRRLWEFLAEDSLEEGLDLSGSDRFAFSVDDAISVSNARSAMSKRPLLLSKLKQGFLGKHNKENKSSFFGLARKEKLEPEEVQEKPEPEEEQRSTKSCRRRKMGPVDPDHVLRAMSRALELTELAYLDMTDKVLDRYPELALMGSCLLVVLMRGEDVYVMNVGDSRAIVAQYQPEKVTLRTERNEEHSDSVSNTEGIIEETEKAIDIEENKVTNEATKLTSLQLSTDHSTSIDEEVVRIKNEHPDDSNCIANDRVKGRLKVTRAFGAGFLKKPKLNDALLEMFRNEYIGTAPYISCSPSLRHHKLCPKDQFLVLSSDGLYQYFTNQEVVSFVENFMEKYPDGDPAQHLIEELLVRAAKKAGMDFHELLDIPQGDRRKYHDDVTVMVISLEGRIWKSSGKYP